MRVKSNALRPTACLIGNRRAWRAVCGGLGLLLASGLAAAQSCTVSATSTAFGTYNPLSATALDANGTVTVSCATFPVALFLNYTVSLSAGQSGTQTSRRMVSGAHQLNYQLYTNLSRTTPWGNGTQGTGTVSGGFLLAVLTTTAMAHTVYGRMPALQSTAAPGSYSDVIIVTVSY